MLNSLFLSIQLTIDNVLQAAIKWLSGPTDPLATSIVTPANAPREPAVAVRKQPAPDTLGWAHFRARLYGAELPLAERQRIISLWMKHHKLNAVNSAGQKRDFVIGSLDLGRARTATMHRSVRDLRIYEHGLAVRSRLDWLAEQNEVGAA